MLEKETETRAPGETSHADGPGAPAKSEARRRRKAGWVVFLLAVACASVNVTKAVHIDDSGDLEIARGIRQDPLHPMRHEFLWHGDSPEPAFRTNQPHLLFYLQALLLAVFGESELAQHLLMALIVWGGLWVFYLLARLLAPDAALFLTALFALGPSLLPGQNIMTDAPLTALWMLFYWALFSAREERQGSRASGYLAASVAAAAAGLVKYSSLVLIVVFLIVIVMRRHWRFMWVVIVPVGAQVAYGAFTWYDFGAVHVLARATPPLAVWRMGFRCADWIVGLGAIAPFTLAFLSWSNLKRLSGWILMASVVDGLVVCAVCRMVYHHAWGNSLFLGFFFGNGVFCLSLIARGAIHGFATRRLEFRGWNEDNIILLLWLLSGFCFIVLFAPDMAIRHILPVVPAVLLLLARNLRSFVERRWAMAALAATAALGFLLAIADWRTADVYRKAPSAILRQLPPGSRVWQVGHWGWQWYAEKAGMLQYCATSSVLNRGDYLIIPFGVFRQAIADRDKAVLKEAQRMRIEGDGAMWFRTMYVHGGEEGGSAGYYAYSLRFGEPPWRFQTGPLEEFIILRSFSDHEG